MLFSLTSLEMSLVVFGLMLGATGFGLYVGRHLANRREHFHEAFSVMQATLVGLVVLLLAFSLTMAVDRYDQRRAANVDEANAISSAYGLAQALPEPYRTESMREIVLYADQAIVVAESVPGGERAKAAIAAESALQRSLWAKGLAVLEARPVDSAARLYIESLDEMSGLQATHVSELDNRVPSEIVFVQLAGAALALGLLAAYVALSGRGFVAVILAAVMISVLLLITFDLDRPARGLVPVPADALVSLRAGLEPVRIPPLPDQSPLPTQPTSTG